MFTQDTIAAITGVIIITLPIFIGVFIIFRAIKKEVIKEMREGKAFRQAFKLIFNSDKSYYENYNQIDFKVGCSPVFMAYDSYSGNTCSNHFSPMPSGSSFMTDPKYCSISGNLYFNSSITGKY